MDNIMLCAACEYEGDMASDFLYLGEDEYHYLWFECPSCQNELMVSPIMKRTESGQPVGFKFTQIFPERKRHIPWVIGIIFMVAGLLILFNTEGILPLGVAAVLICFGLGSFKIAISSSDKEVSRLTGYTDEIRGQLQKHADLVELKRISESGSDVELFQKLTKIELR